MRRELSERWPLRDRHDLRDELLAAWDRDGYHDLVHLAEVLDRLDQLAAAGADFDRVEVELAAWFHDAHFSGERDDEERSALWAETTLTGPLATEVSRLVRMTADHRPEPGDLNGAALSDADLGILAADPERYSAYAADVRLEYAHVPDEAFAAGRASVLEQLLGKHSLFHTRPARDAWESTARANVEAELRRLSAQISR